MLWSLDGIRMTRVPIYTQHLATVCIFGTISLLTIFIFFIFLGLYTL
jgi:hypothetical protein